MSRFSKSLWAKSVLAVCVVFSGAIAFAQVPGAGRPPAPNLPSQTPGAQESLPSSDASERDVVYGKAGGTTLKLDVYRPKAKNAVHRAIVLIHGGAWIEGDKSSFDALARWLAKNGYVAFSINYRLFDNANGHNAWPVQLDDAQMAVRWIRANAKKYDIDPAKIGAVGHSAGAQMVSLLGELETRDNSDAALAAYSSKVQAVLDLSGPIDMVKLQAPGGDPFLSKFLGGTSQGNPAAWKSASPNEQIGKDTAPFLIIHGTQDKEVPIGQSQEFAAALKKAGVDVTLIEVNDVHSFETDSARKRVAVESVAFFNRTLL